MPIDCHRGAGVVASVLLGLGGNEPPSLRGKHCDLYDWDAVWVGQKALVGVRLAFTSACPLVAVTHALAP